MLIFYGGYLKECTVFHIFIFGFFQYIYVMLSEAPKSIIHINHKVDKFHQNVYWKWDLPKLEKFRIGITETIKEHFDVFHYSVVYINLY